MTHETYGEALERAVYLLKDAMESGRGTDLEGYFDDKYPVGDVEDADCLVHAGAKVCSNHKTISGGYVAELLFGGHLFQYTSDEKYVPYGTLSEGLEI